MNIKIKAPINENFSEAILFILKNTSPSDIGLKKLAKLLYFSDFNRYKKCYKSITDLQYSRMDYGPFPKKLYLALEELKKQGWIEIKKINYNDQILGKNISLIKEFKPKYLSKEEQAEILNVIKKIGSLTGTQLGDLSHEDTPWQVTNDDELIDYDLVFYRDEKIIRKVE